ncbi:MAG: carbon starvation protein A, partial [Abditibacteriota bacterium]|nr:carbon starvation protein A [Abditibacteriota bacterium]
MSGLLIILIAIVVLGGGYLLYGRYLANKWGIDPNAKTPAYTENDGVDYVPASPGVVFGHQFASIAGAGPINGPIQAAVFGWLPVLLWILIGGVFIGGVQDFSAMYASVKNKGRTIGYIIELYIGKLGKKLFLAFTWLFSILVVAAFADIVAKTFNGVGGTAEANLAGGRVSMTSMLFIFLAVILGFILKSGKLSTALNTVITVGFLVCSIVFGMMFPVCLGTNVWHVITFIYIAIASVTPVWALLQPRDYLNSYLLVVMIVLAAAGIVVANPTMELPAFSGWQINGQNLFPYLFVTVACGAVSGFHAMVSSGTASKQVKNETHMLPISYGAMMMECLLAVISVVAVGACYTSATLADAGTPTVVFANSISGFLTGLGLPSAFSYTLLTLAVSAFALTSLDSVARVGRLA